MPQNLSIDEIEAIFEEYRVIQPPKHIIVYDCYIELPYDEEDPAGTIYRGLQPNWRDDMIILSVEGDDETVIHEALHANYGTEEWFTYPAGEWLIKKYRGEGLIGKLPHSRRVIKYDLCKGCSICDNPDVLGVKLAKKDKNKYRHYILSYSHRKRATFRRK